MATPLRHAVRCLLRNTVKDVRVNLRALNFQSFAAVQSQYAPSYLDPTFRKDHLEQPLAEDDLRNFRPIKAATNEQTSSSNYDDLIQKFIRHITREGRKDRATLIVHRTLENLKLIQLEKYHKAKTDEEKANIELDPKVIFHEAVDNCRPLLMTQKVKRGGVMYQVPIPVKPNYQTFTAMKWIIESATEKERNVRIWDKLANELLDAYRKEGKSVRKKQELHRHCEANRAYAHFRW